MRVTVSKRTNMPRASRQMSKWVSRFLPKILGEHSSKVKTVCVNVQTGCIDFGSAISVKQEFLRLQRAAKTGNVYLKFDNAPGRDCKDGRFWVLIHELIHLRQFFEGSLKVSKSKKFNVSWKSKRNRIRTYPGEKGRDIYIKYNNLDNNREKKIRYFTGHFPWESEPHRIADDYWKRYARYL